MWKLKDLDETKQSLYLQKGFHRLISRLLAQRNIDIDQIDKYINSDYGDLAHPYDLHGVKEGVELFAKTIKQKQKIAVIGDYDADGVVSSTMIKDLCRVFQTDCEIFIPSRLDHGYGLNPKSTKAFKEKHKDSIPDLLIILDCGSNSKHEIQELKEFGIKHFLIIDHHLINENFADNADVVISWHLSDNKEEMCTCGQIYQFIRGIRLKTDKVNPISFLFYAAIGTVADVSPLIGSNRIIVKNGLTQFSMSNTPSAGIFGIIDEWSMKKGYLTQEDVGFKIAPKINAVGRIFHADLALGLLTERDPSSAEKIAQIVIKYNEERRGIQKKAEKIALDELKKYKERPYGVVIINQNFHVGVVGIVSSRVTEELYRPSLVIGNLNGVWKGSGRSIPGVNIKEILDDCKEAFVLYGGHKAAVGLTLKTEYADKINDMFNASCKKYFNSHEIGDEPVRYYDAALKLPAVNIENATIIFEKMAPFCATTNPQPLFLLKDVIVNSVEIKDGQGWKLMKFKLSKDGFKSDYCFKSFGITNKFGSEIEGMSCNVYFTFPQNIDDKFELNVVDLEFSKID